MFNELFFLLYDYIRHIESNKNPAVTACIIIIVLQGMNIMSLYMVVNYYFAINIMTKDNYRLICIILILILVFKDYSILFKKRNNIFAKYEHLTPQRKDRGRSFLWLYIGLSLATMFSLMGLLVKPQY